MNTVLSMNYQLLWPTIKILLSDMSKLSINLPLRYYTVETYCKANIGIGLFSTPLTAGTGSQTPNAGHLLPMK